MLVLFVFFYFLLRTWNVLVHWFAFKVFLFFSSVCRFFLPHLNLTCVCVTICCSLCFPTTIGVTRLSYNLFHIFYVGKGWIVIAKIDDWMHKVKQFYWFLSILMLRCGVVFGRRGCWWLVAVVSWAHGPSPPHAHLHTHARRHARTYTHAHTRTRAHKHAH